MNDKILDTMLTTGLILVVSSVVIRGVQNGSITRRLVDSIGV